MRMRADQRREQLLDTVRDLVGELGFHAVSIEAVARRAGVTRPVVYGHFADLDALLAALVQREGARALDQLAAVLPRDQGEDRAGVLLAALRGYLEAVRAEPVTWRLVLMPPEGAPTVLRERIADGRAGAIAQLAAFVGPGLLGGEVSPDPELTARTLSALADETARLVLTEPERYPVDRLVAHAGWFLGQLGPVT